MGLVPITAGAARELGYAEITAGFTVAGTANTPSAVTGLSVTVTTGTRPIYIETFSPTAYMTTGSATANIGVRIYEDGSMVQSGTILVPGANLGTFAMVGVRRNPSAGSHTYDVRVTSATATTWGYNASATTPAWIRVFEV